MVNSKTLGLIGLAMKAGKVCFGTDSVEENILKRRVKLIILAEDASDRTRKNFIDVCEKCNIPIIIDSDIETLSKTIGKSNKAVIGIKDLNFADSIQKKYNGGDIIG